MSYRKSFGARSRHRGRYGSRKHRSSYRLSRGGIRL